MSDQNPYDPKTQPKEWQAWINEQIAAHDAQQQSSGNENQEFEINPGSEK